MSVTKNPLCYTLASGFEDLGVMDEKKPRTKQVRILAETADLAYQLAPILGNGDVADFIESILRPALEKLRPKAIEKLRGGKSHEN